MSVIALDAAGATSPAVTRSLTVDAAPSPLTVTFKAPAAATTINPALGGAYTLNYTIHVENAGSGTIGASGITLTSGDSLSTQSAPVDLGNGDWRIDVAYQGAATTGSRTATPTVKVVDSNGISSTVVSGPVITIKTVSLVDTPPVVTMTATPKILAGANSTWQGVPIEFKATATDDDGDTLTYSWAFGDGGKGDVAPTQDASVLNQTHTFSAANVYPVVFTANDGRTGGTKTITLNLNILANSAPTLSVAQTPVGQPYANVPLTFTATVADADGDTPALSWDFGDTGTATGSPVTHSFAAAGTTVVKVTADDGKGGVTTRTLNLDVLANRPPVSTVATPATNLYQNKAYTFTATATDPDAGNTISQYQWDFGDGTAIQSSATSSISHTYASNFVGNASVKVRAVDNHGSTGDFSPAVVFPVVATPLPVVTFASPLASAVYKTEPGSSVNVVYIVGVTNPNGTAGTYVPLSGITFTPGESTATVLSRVDNGNGTYTFQVNYKAATIASTRLAAVAVIATDGQGISSLTTAAPSVTINTQEKNTPPVVTLTSTPTIPAGTNSTYLGVPIAFNGTATDPDGDPLTYTLDFGDGSTVAKTVVPAGGTLSIAPHTYATAKTYSAVLTVDDGRTDGQKSVTLAMNILPNAAPTVAVTWTDPKGNVSPASTYSNLPLTFTAAAADSDGDTVNLTWDFGDGTPKVTGTGLTQTHTFAATGSTKVVVTADDGKGNAGTAPSWTTSLNVQANHAPVAQVTTPTATLNQNKSYTFTASATDQDSADTIDHYEWDFGDGSTTGLTSSTPSTTHLFTNAASVTVKVRAVDNHGTIGDYSPAVNFTVVASTNPAVAFITPAMTLSLNAGSTVEQDILFTVTNPNASLGATDPLPVSGIAFNANDANATAGSVTWVNGNTYKARVRYSAATTVGSRSATPTASAKDSLGIPNAPVAVSGNAITIKTDNFAKPSIAVTAPAASSNTAYTLANVSLGFTVTNPAANPTTYTVDWGDATSTSIESHVLTDAALASGVPLSLTHAYQAAGTFTVTLTASDTRSDSTSTAVPQFRTFTVSENAYPTARITSPQASATLPTAIDSQEPATPVIKLSPTADDASIVVIPLNGKLNFKGTATGPSAGTYQSKWTFQGGVPSTFSGNEPGEVVFPGEAGKIMAYLVTFKAVDQFDRSSSDPATVKASSWEKWIIVDGVNTQNFNLSFQYRKKGDNSATVSLTPVQTPANGLGASIQIFQDGANNTYPVRDAQGINATVSIPVRSNLPFQFKMPSDVAAAAGDGVNYMMQIPNAPSVDPALGISLQTGVSSFGFANPAATSAPWWGPTLQIVTAQGFADETTLARERKMQGMVYFNQSNPADPLNMVIDKAISNSRWFDRLSIPLLPGDSLGAIQLEENNGVDYAFSGLRATQLFAEWPIYLMTKVPTTSTTATKADTSAKSSFILDWPTYTKDTPSTDTGAVFKMQAWRIPKAVTDPYDLSLAGWNDSSVTVALNPTEMGASVQSSFAQMLQQAPGTTPLAGGINALPSPFDFNEANWTPKGYAYESTHALNFQPTRATFSYAEYLWSSVWARPLVLNRTNVDYLDTTNLIPELRNSQPAAWPKHSGITPGNGAFDMTTSGVGVFDGSAPCLDNGSPSSMPGKTGVGRFYWTAYTPFYTAAGGSVIARTWLGLNDGLQLPPTDFSAVVDGSARGTDAVFNGDGSLATAGVPGTVGNPVAKIGFVPPPMVIVDKRTLLNGVPQDGTVGGYRVRWFNATKDQHGNPVPPDFWVVEFSVPSGTYHYMLPSSYPATIQKVTDPVVTDARLYLPSTCIPYDPSDSTPATTTQGPRPDDLVAPGYCWFDVPAELRAEIDTPSTTCAVTVFAIKAFPNGSKVTGARALQRPDWIDAIKTATAAVKAHPGTKDLGYVYKIPFNYAWDIVIANGPRTLVAP